MLQRVKRVTVAELLPYLEGVQERGTWWSALCPIDKAQLGVTAGKDGFAKTKCPKGCLYDDIVGKANPEWIIGPPTLEEIRAIGGFDKPTLGDVSRLVEQCRAMDQAPELILPHQYRAKGLQIQILGEPAWAVEGYFSVGVSLVVAHSKIGKSYFVLDAAVSVAYGGKAWGAIQCRKGAVLYIDTEGNKRRMQRRLRDLLGESEQWPENLIVSHERIPLDEAGLAIIRTMVEINEGVIMVILDTLNAMRPGKKSNGDLVKQDYDMIRALRALGEELEIAIVLVHHCALGKKDDTVNAGAGTHGLAAAASAILTMERVRGEKDGVVSITGNDIEEERKDHFVRLDNGFWAYQGSAAQLKANQQRQDVFDLITENGPMAPSAIAKALKKGVSATKMLLRRMAYSGDLIAAGGFYEIPERQ